MSTIIIQINNMDIYTTSELKLVYNALVTIKKLKYVEYMKKFDDNSAEFMWSTNKKIYNLGKALKNDRHSGASFACTMRLVQACLMSHENVDISINTVHNLLNNAVTN